LILCCGLFLERYYFAQVPNSDAVRNAFIAEIGHYRPVLKTQISEPRTAEAFDFGDLIRLLPRSTLAIIIVISAASLAALVMSSWVFEDKDPHQSARNTHRPERDDFAENDVARRAPAAQAAANLPAAEETLPAPVQATSPAPVAAAAAVTPASAENCRCTRADSVLWGDGFPRITTLLIEQGTRRHKDHQHIELELGAINNGSQTLGEIHLSVLFFEGESKESINERPLFYEGPLRPGQAIKWHVQSRGTRFEIRNPTREVLKDREREFASPDSFAQLLTSANHRPVRLHAAMMLAFLGDARSKQGALGLKDALREVEAPYLDRVLATQGDALSCDWRVSSEGRVRKLSACIYNRSGKKLDNLSVRGRALDRYFDHRNPNADPPIVLAEQQGTFKQSLDAGQGVPVVLDLDTDNNDGRLPVAFELLVDDGSL
jgi:hypothetical protein